MAKFIVNISHKFSVLACCSECRKQQAQIFLPSGAAVAHANPQHEAVKESACGQLVVVRLLSDGWAGNSGAETEAFGLHLYLCIGLASSVLMPGVSVSCRFTLWLLVPVH